ncbi:GntR family transcriptional regulator [Bacillus alkalicellulosilyticus]|uniref:GntR family transcriptional regulator n=1 Tax=Alkalihalobacterium alkalicellulosilyticum TaxID=1912214 RepID=UPI0009984FA7|nr:GntR family transcriptional regulator [Bacillus alkalicellulosilyticus]
MFEFDPRNRSPIFEQIVEKIKELIINQVLSADEKLPSVRALSSEITVNPNTIQKAYRELERQGYLYSFIGKGYYVSPVETMPSNDKLKSIEEDLLKLLTEAIFLGLSEKRVLTLFKKAKAKTEGGE